jgi:hypothetical protein
MSTRSDSWDSRSVKDNYGECGLFLFDYLFDYYDDFKEDLEKGTLKVENLLMECNVGPIKAGRSFHEAQFDFGSGLVFFINGGATRCQADIYWGISRIVQLAELPDASIGEKRILPISTDPQSCQDESVWDSRRESNQSTNIKIRSPFEYLLRTKEPIVKNTGDQRTYTLKDCTVTFGCGPFEEGQRFDEVFVRIQYNEIIFVNEEKKLYYAGRIFWGLDNIETFWNPDESEEEEDEDKDDEEDDEYKDDEEESDSGDESADDDTNKRKSKGKSKDSKKKPKKTPEEKRDDAKDNEKRPILDTNEITILG